MSDLRPLYYDVFISYARDEYDWVESHLYEPLTRCRRTDGEQPQIFLDCDAMDPGVKWRASIADALQVSRRIIGVHSRRYFASGHCREEWQMAMTLDEQRNGQPSLLCPILKDPLEPEIYLPLWCQSANYIDVPKQDDWFDVLRRHLELAESTEMLSVEFETQPHGVQVNQTLNEVRVRLTSRPPRRLRDELVRISASTGTLSGEREVQTDDGVAVFSDLSLGTAQSEVHLEAEADGYEAGRSDAFSVEETRAIQSPDLTQKRDLCIETDGNVRFFPASESIAVIQPDRLLVYDDRAARLAEIPLGGPIKSADASGRILAVTEWSGRVVLLRADGGAQAWDPPLRDGLFDPVPAGACVLGDTALVGFWSGEIVAYELDQEPRPVARLEAGVQSIGTDGEGILVATSHGRLQVMRDGQVEVSHDLEPGNLYLKAFRRRVIVAGDRHLFCVDLDSPGARLLRQAHPLENIAAVFWQSSCPVLIGEQGRGVRIDRGLNYRVRFHSAAGAIPVSADDGGTYCVLRNPDGSHTLMEDAKMVYTHSEGILAVSPDAERFAVGNGSAIELLKAADFNRLRHHA